MYDPHSPLLRSGTTGFHPPAPETKTRFAQQRLCDAVIRCEIAPGATITEAEAMDRFGLTRAAARAGLTRLDNDGWARPQARSGWLVLPVTGALICQVLQARRAAEPLLADAAPTRAAGDEMRGIAGIMPTLENRREPAVVASVRHYAERVDTLLLAAINPFTARHLRELWDHTDRIIRFLGHDDPDGVFCRDDVPGLIGAVLSGDHGAIVRARLLLIDRQEGFILRLMLQNNVPLAPGGTGPARHDETCAADNRRMT